jgi:hypothetical protein
MDINDPASSPHGAQFIPRLPIEGSEPIGIDPFPPTLALSDRNGPVWYGMEVKPYHTSCLYGNRYGLTGKTSNTAKTAKNEAEVERG